MALNSPQADLPIRLRGGADVWDEGAAGLILSSEFFVESSVGTIYNVGCSELTDAAEESGQSLVTETDISQSSNSDHESGVILATESLVGELADSVGETLSAATAKLALAEGVRTIEDVAQHVVTGLTRVSEPAVFADGFRLTETGTGSHFSSGGSADTDAIKSTGLMSFVYQVSAGRLLIFDPGFGSLAFTSDGTYDANNSEMSPTLLRSVSVTEPVSGYYRVSVDLAGYTNYVTFRVYTTSHQISYLGDDVSNFYLADLKFTGQLAIPIKDTSEKTQVRTVYAEGIESFQNMFWYTTARVTRSVDTSQFDDGYKFTETAKTGTHLLQGTTGFFDGYRGFAKFSYKAPSDRAILLYFLDNVYLWLNADGTVQVSNSSIPSGATYTTSPVGNGFHEVRLYNWYKPENLVSDIGQAWLTPQFMFAPITAKPTIPATLSYLGDISKSYSFGNLHFDRVTTPTHSSDSSLGVSVDNLATTSAIDAEDYSWTGGNTNVDADQSDPAYGLDESTTLMLALLNEHAATTAIDLPAGQYTVINDATETALGVDAPVGSYTTTSARTEAGSADSADDVDQSTGVSGVALGTASEAASNIASITAARSESGISVETQAGSMNTTKTQAEVGNLSDAGLSTMVTTGTSVEAVVAIDSLSQTVTTAVSLLAGLTATEAQVTIYSFSVADLEGALADADQSGSANFASTREEGITALEASTGSANLGTTLTEAIPATEESGYQTNLLNLSRTEASPLVDVPSSVMVAFAQITGVGTLAEVVQGSNTTQSSSLEALVSAAIQAGVMNWLSQAAESVTSGGTLNSNVSTNTTATEAVTANTYADNGGATTAVAQEPAPSWDDPQGTAVSLISRTEPAAAVDFSSQGATTQAASTEAAAPSESASTLVAGAAATTATGAATDLPGATHSGFATSQELAAAADQINAGLLTILSTIAAAVGGDVSTAVGSIDLTLVDVAQATEGTAELVAFTGTLLEVVTLGDDYLCTLVSDITLDEQATAVTLQLADLNVILDVLKLQNVFLVSREVRGHRIGMDLRDLVVEIERRGFDVPQDIREIAVAIERRSYNVTK